MGKERIDGGEGPGEGKGREEKEGETGATRVVIKVVLQVVG